MMTALRINPESTDAESVYEEKLAYGNVGMRKNFPLVTALQNAWRTAVYMVDYLS